MLSDAFAKLKSNLELNDTFDGLIQQKHNAVRSKVENSRPGTQTKLIGSLQRKTRIQPRQNDTFDIDILVQLGEFYNWVTVGGVSPEQALGEVHKVVHQSERYSSLGPQISSPTVAFEYKDGVKIELVPAYLDKIGHSHDKTPHHPVGRAFWVPKEGGGWKLADYDFDADYITAQNTASDGLLIPAIKMLKAIRREYFPQMSSYHLEVLAGQYIPIIVAINKRFNTPSTFDSLTTDFFKLAIDCIDAPTRIPGSHTPEVSLSATDAASVKSTFEKIKRYCESANTINGEGDKKKHWKELFGEPFPASI